MKLFNYAIPALLLLAAGSLSASAATLTPDQALERALKSSHRLIKGASSKNYTLAFSDISDVYVFANNNNGGYLVLSGDDAAEPVLGYADNGTFSPDSMPPAMIWWLGEYSRQIQAAANSFQSPALVRPERSPISPLLATRWDQSSPYNDLCPTVNGKRSVTGCTATAMAQVMNWHKWPEKGKGSHSYSSNGTSISLDFSTIEFDWQNMADSYTTTQSSQANQAVAQLMYACGVSINMQYSPEASAATDFYMPIALTDYFGYDAGACFLQRDFYGIADWEDMIYNQLKDYGPVEYSGQSNQGGHSFVCDGYSSDGYFHINWGWSGVSDGYFLLTALDPAQQGIGGSTSGFNFDQSIVANVCKPREGSSMVYNLTMATSLGIEESSAKPNEYVTVTGNIYNFSTGKVSGNMGVKLTPADDGEPIYVQGSTVSAIEPLSGIGAYYIIMPKLAAGTYNLTPTFMPATKRTWQDIPVKLSEVQEVTVSVDEQGVATFTPGKTASIRASSVKLQSPLYLENQFRLTAVISNDGDKEYLGEITPVLIDNSGKILAMADEYAVDVEGKSRISIEYIGSFYKFSSTGAPEPGIYRLCLIDADYNALATLSVSVKSAPTDTKISVSDFKLSGDSNNVNPENASFEAIVKCDKGYFSGSLYLWVFEYSTSGTSGITYLTTNPVFIEAGQEEAITAAGALTGVVAGKKYMAALFSDNDQVSDLILFTAGDPAQVQLIADGNTPLLYPCITDGYVSVNYGAELSVRVFSTTGAQVLSASGNIDSIDFSALPAGMYIVELTYGHDMQSRSIQKIIRR